MTTHSARILVVEDNDDVRDMIQLYLEASGFQVSAAPDGPKGLEVALRERPDVILMDLGLPGMDGLELARKLRESGLRARIVAMSGYAKDYVKHRAEHAGADESVVDLWLVKPVQPERLLQVVQAA